VGDIVEFNCTLPKFGAGNDPQLTALLNETQVSKSKPEHYDAVKVSVYNQRIPI